MFVKLYRQLLEVCLNLTNSQSFMATALLRLKSIIITLSPENEDLCLSIQSKLSVLSPQFVGIQAR